MAIQASNITDLVNATLKKYGKRMLTDAMSTLQTYVAAERLLNKKRMKFDSGEQYRFNLIHTADSNTRAVGFFEVDNLDQVDGTAYGTVPWRFVETGTHYDVKQLSVNSGAERIFDFVKTKEYQMWQNFWDRIEAYFWDGPSSSADDKTPFGLFQYWLDYDGTTGFNGGNHTNWSSGPAGIDCDVYTRYKHYTAAYTNVSDTDLLRKMRTAYRQTDFRGIPNKPIKGYEDGVGHNFGIYTTLDTLSELEELLDEKNMNKEKNELARYDDQVAFRRIPVEWVPYLQENKATSDPVVGLDWNCVNLIALSNEWMRQTPYHRAGDQHDVRQRFVNCSFNIVMPNRRAHFLIAKASPLTS